MTRLKLMAFERTNPEDPNLGRCPFGGECALILAGNPKLAFHVCACVVRDTERELSSWLENSYRMNQLP